MAAAQGRSSWYYMDEAYAKQWQLIMMINWWVYMSNVYAIASEVISSPIRIENNSVRASVFRLNDKQMFVSFSWLSWVGGTEALQESCILTVRIRDDRMRIKESTNLNSLPVQPWHSHFTEIVPYLTPVKYDYPRATLTGFCYFSRKTERLFPYFSFLLKKYQKTTYNMWHVWPLY